MWPLKKREATMKRKILYKIGQVLDLLFFLPILTALVICDTVVTTASYFWRELKWNLRMEVRSTLSKIIENIFK